MPPHVVRWVREQAWFLLVLATAAAGFGYLVYGHGHWRRSTFVIGVAMILAALVRLCLRPGKVGLLAVRGRYLDAAWYAGLGVVILAADLRLNR